MNILITAAATAQAYHLQRLLNTDDSIYLADYEELPQVVLKGTKFLKIPSGNSPSFAHLLLTVCLDNDIEKVCPLRSEEVIAHLQSKVGKRIEGDFSFEEARLLEVRSERTYP